MTQYECKNICQVAHKIAEMTNTILDIKILKTFKYILTSY